MRIRRPAVAPAREGERRQTDQFLERRAATTDRRPAGAATGWRPNRMDRRGRNHPDKRGGRAAAAAEHGSKEQKC
ncbi:MAG: hypothetical protein QNJ94_22055 [Alphaproteobacteria bacterium]|nr:hypothetical protein [Alphaproteobacteria bacterium]